MGSSTCGTTHPFNRSILCRPRNHPPTVSVSTCMLAYESKSRSICTYTYCPYRIMSSERLSARIHLMPSFHAIFSCRPSRVLADWFRESSMRHATQIGLPTNLYNPHKRGTVVYRNISEIDYVGEWPDAHVCGERAHKTILHLLSEF